MNKTIHIALYAFIGVLLAGCASSQKQYEKPLYETKVLSRPHPSAWEVDEVSRQQLESLSPGQRPPTDSDEAGLWMVMDKAEARYKTAGKRIKDDKLNAYLGEIVCRLTPAHCHDIRVYVMRVPYFNAFMAPNGAMVIWSGLLLRVRNEAQLASVLGHEIGHYLRRHALQQMKTAAAASSGMAFLRLAAAAASIGFAGDIAALSAAGGIAAYGRDMEREADGYGIALLARAGYNPKASSAIWRQVIKEKEARDDKNFSLLLFDTHPPSQERLEALDRLASKILAAGKAFKTETDGYLNRLAPFRFDFLKDELHLRNFSGLEVVLDSLLAQKTGRGEIFYFKGELYRLRGNKGDVEKAFAAYQKAIREPAFPADTFRSLGILYRAQGADKKAADCFIKYLETCPDAIDGDMIRHMLKRSFK